MYSVERTSASLTQRPAPCQYRQSISPSPQGFGRRRATLHVERRPHNPPSGPNRRLPPERHRTTRIFLACTLSPQGSEWRTIPHRSRGMQAPSSSKISTGYQPAVTGFPPRDSSRSPGSLRAGPREDAPTGDPARDRRFRDIPADATRPDQLRIDPAREREGRSGPSSGSCCARATCRSSEGHHTGRQWRVCDARRVAVRLSR